MNMVEIVELVSRNGKDALGVSEARRAVQRLSAADCHLVSERPTVQSIAELLGELNLRKDISLTTGQEIYGLQAMIDRFRETALAGSIVGYSFISMTSAGRVFFDADGQLLGVVLVNRPADVGTRHAEG